MGKKTLRTSDELRPLFLEFFREKGHPILPASPLATHDDPTLLFTTAGMVQFKSYYVAKGPIPYRRAATVQPCLRSSDLESVGVTSRHHTFFEMLGNFSFGDYFKEEAIRWAWEFSTDRLGLPAEKIWVSVFEEDEEAWEIWEKKVGVDSRRIVRLGVKDNFWGPAGESGPCGPCSELYLDTGEGRGCGRPECVAGCDCDRYLEYWNLVFPQYDQTPGGERLPLANRGIDTGLGLERLAQLVQEVPTNYDTDLFAPILDVVRGFSRGLDPDRGEGLTGSRVIADHVRALVFAVNEGILPGNEGRGYVLRRILRRALLRASRLGIEDLFLDEVGGAVVDRMSGAYPDLGKNRGRILSMIRSEEERFRRTLEQGLDIFRRIARQLRERGERVLPGREIFRLYDTYGFPVELTEEMAVAEGLTLDQAGFDASMEEQRNRSRWTTGAGAPESVDLSDVQSEFVGYAAAEAETEVAALLKEGERVENLPAGERGVVLLARSPFYGESGGQVGDTGRLEDGQGNPIFAVLDTTRSQNDHPLLHGSAKAGLRVGSCVRASIDSPRREAIQRNHTATHLLHRALREVLGEHVHQAGSLVAPDRLRFDFVHHSRARPEEISRVEEIVNRKVQENHPVEIRIVAFAEAQNLGATALFGEKYGEQVRMVSIGAFSRELCGGTHLKATGEIGPFLIVTETAVGSGIRRVEAITGDVACRTIQEARRALAQISESLRTNVEEAPARVEALQEKLLALEKELARARQHAAGDQVQELLDGATRVGDVRVVAAKLDGRDPSTLRGLIDRLQEESQPLVAILGTQSGEKAFLVATVSKDLVKRGLSAGDLIGKVAAKVGGQGGGKATFAQAGGKEPERLDEALQSVPELVRGIVTGG